MLLFGKFAALPAPQYNAMRREIIQRWNAMRPQAAKQGLRIPQYVALVAYSNEKPAGLNEAEAELETALQRFDPLLRVV